MPQSSSFPSKPLRLFLLWALLPIALAVHGQKTYHGDGCDDVLEWIPIASVYVMKAAGVESASSWKRLAVNSAISFALAAGSTWALKHSIHERRPDWSDRRSFPSGHTAVAFAGAVVLDKEYRKVSPWISVAGYAVATGVAIDRVARNRHHWQDVCAGAALGAGGTLLGYWIGDKITGQHSRYQVGVGTDGLSLVVNLDP